jgi:cell division protein FtsN
MSQQARPVCTGTAGKVLSCASLHEENINSDERPTSVAKLALYIATLSQPSKVKPSQAKPSQAKPSQAKPSQAKPSQTKPNQAKPSQAKKAITVTVCQILPPNIK